MNSKLRLSPMACAFMMRSMLALQPVWEVTGARRGAQAPGNHHRLHLRAQYVLHPGQEALHLLGVPLVVGLLAVAQVQPLLGDGRTGGLQGDGGPPSPWSPPCRRP